MATITLTEQAGSTGYFTFTIKASVSQDSPKDHTKYWIKWTYSPITAFAERKTKQTQIIAGTSVTEVFTDLKPNKSYIVEADLVKTLTATTIEAFDSINIGTLSLGGQFNCASRSSSVISMALTGLPVFDFDAEISFLYKRSTDPDNDAYWKTGVKKMFDAGAEITLSHMFTGLSQNMAYDFKATLTKVVGTNRRGWVLIDTFTKTVRTLIYSGGVDEVVPSFKEIITVGNTGKGCVIAETNIPLPNGCTVHLYKADVLSDEFTDIGALDGNLKKIVTQTAGDVVRYKLAVVDSGGNVHTETSPTAVGFSYNPWTNKVQGNPFDINAEVWSAWANSIASLHRYCDAVGLNDDDTEQVANAKKYTYERLVASMPSAVKGNPFRAKSSVLEWTDALAQIYSQGSVSLPVTNTGYPIYASDINSVIAHAEDALAIII